MRTTKAMRSMLTAVLVLAFGVVGAMPAVGGQDGGNGYLLMVHTTFEPRPQDDGVPGPPAQEAFVGTQDDGKVVLRFIPYTTDGLEPVVVEDPLVAVTSPGTNSSIVREPEGSPKGDAVCEEETSLAGHAGSVWACLVLELDAEDLPPGDGLLVSLLFADDAGRQIEHYNSVGHVALHDAIEGGAADPEVADAMFTQPTPVVVETAVDPQP